jgi:hypothetical protein
MPEDSYRVLLKLAHTVLDELPGGDFDPVEAMEALKRKAALARIPYASTAARKALESAHHQQRRQHPNETATRLLVDVLEAQAGKPMALDTLNQAVWRLFGERYPLADAENRDDILTRAWNRRLLEAQPDIFRIVGRELDHVVLTRREMRKP